MAALTSPRNDALWREQFSLNVPGPASQPRFAFGPCAGGGVGVAAAAGGTTGSGLEGGVLSLQPRIRKGAAMRTARPYERNGERMRDLLGNRGSWPPGHPRDGAF